MSHPLQQFFAQVPLFSKLSGDELNELLRAIKPSQLKEGEFLCKEGDPSNAAYVIQSGTLDVFLERKDVSVPLAQLGANDVLGEIALLDGQPRTAHVRAMSDVTLFEIDRAEFDFLRRNLHPAAYKVIREIAITLCDRVRQSNSIIRETVTERDQIESGQPVEDMIESDEIDDGDTLVDDAEKSVLSRLAFWRNK